MTDQLYNLNPEEKLLLSLCRLEFSEQQKAETGDLMNEIKDWDHFVKLVNNHGIIALAAYNIKENGLADQVPEAAMKILDNGLMQSTIRNTWLVQRWKEMNKILSEAGIKHVLLKGMALEYTVYRSRGLRQMTDNDILVKKEDALKAWQLLQKHGFVPDMIKSPLHRKIITETGKHLPTLRKDDYPLEIHHRLFFEADRNEILDTAIENATAIEVEGTRAFVLKNEIHLEYLKKHYNDHLITGGTQLRLWLDIELIAPQSAPVLTVDFIRKLKAEKGEKQQKEHYRIHYFSLPRSARLRYLAGDIFPSLMWLKVRHGCKGLRALTYYPRRLGKLGWIWFGKGL